MGDAINKDRLAESDIVNNYIINPAIRSVSINILLFDFMF